MERKINFVLRIYKKLNKSELWKLFLPFRRGVTFYFGGEVMQKVIHNFLTSYLDKLPGKICLISGENFLSDTWFYENLPGRYIPRNSYFIGNLCSLNDEQNKKIRNRITFIKPAENNLFFIKKIMKEETDKIFFIDLPKSELFEEGAEVDYIIDRNLFILQDLHRQAILNDWRIYLFYRLGQESILTLLEDERVKMLMNYYNSVYYFYKKGSGVGVVKYSKGRRSNYICNVKQIFNFSLC